MAALAAAPYLYGRMDEEIRRRVEAKIAEHYSTLSVRVRHAQLVEGEGIEVRGLSISEPGAAGPQSELAYFDELMLTCKTDLEELISGMPKITHVRIRRPVLRATRRPDGGWSVSKLMPWPKFGPNTPDGTIENATFEIFDPLKNPSSTLTLRDIHLAWKPAPDPARPGVNRLEVRGALAGDHIERVEVAGYLEPDTRRWAFNGAVQGLDVSPELRTALPGDIAEKLAVLGNLRAQARLGFQLESDAAAQPPLRFGVTAELNRGRIDDPRLPYPLNDLRAKVRLANDGFTIEDLTARNGSTTLRLGCHASGYEATSPMAIEVSGSRLRLEQQIVGALPRDMQIHWYNYLPQGEVDAEVRLAFDGAKWTPDVLIKCRELSFTHHKFPYRLGQASGTISYAKDTLNLRLTAYSGSQPVRLEGEIHNPGQKFTGSVVIEGDNIPLDEKLLLGLAEKPREVVRSLNPQGTFNFYARLWRDDAERPEVHRHVMLALNRCSMVYEKFPYPLGNIRGTIESLDGSWTFRNLEGVNDTGQVTCHGQLTPTADGQQLTLYLSGQKVPLEEELRDALPPNMQKLWHSLQPRGETDLTAEVSYWPHLRKIGVKVDASPRGDTTSIEPLCFPYRMEELRGSIHYEEGRARLDKLEAVHGRTSLTSGGYCEFQPDGSWRLHLDKLMVSRLAADRDLMSALPEGLKKSAADLKPTGALNLRGTLDFSKAAQAEAPLKTEWDLMVDVHQGSVDCGVKLENIYGGMRLVGSCEGGRYASRGELALDSVSYKNYQFTEVLGPLWFDNGRVLLGSWSESRTPGRVPRRITAKLFSGTLLADCQVTLGVLPQYTLKAALSDANLRQFAQEHLTGRQKLDGKVLAQVELQGSGRGTNSLLGNGTIRVRDADVYELPVMVALLKILSVKEPDTTAFTKSDIDFRIQGEHILFDRINFNGDAISLLGQGQMNLDTQTKLTFHAVVGRDDFHVPILRNVLGEASQQIMQIHVEGPIGNPVMRKEAFPGFNQALQQLQEDLQMNRQPPGGISRIPKP